MNIQSHYWLSSNASASLTHSTIDQEEEEAYQEATSWKDTVARHKILQLKENTIPHGLVPMERIFSKDDIASKPMTLEIEDQVEDYNINS